MFRAHAIDVDGLPFAYRLLEPAEIMPSRKYPLVVFLHGAGERGDDNERQLLPMPAAMAEPGWRTRFPCFLVAVQCPEDMRWVDVPWDEVQSRPMPAEASTAMRAVIAAMRKSWEQNPVDRDRVYLTGVSMGGYGAFDLAMRHPEWFAGVVAVCGGGDERLAHRIAELPLQVWHGADDPVVPVQRSRNMVAALRDLGAPVHYRELAGVQHASWTEAYGEEGALPWLFEQHRRHQGRGEPVPIPLVPWPRHVGAGNGALVLGPRPRIAAPAAFVGHAEVLASELAALTGARPEIGRDDDADIVLELAEGLDDEEYRLDVAPRQVRVLGAGLEGVARGTGTLLQVLQRGESGWQVPALEVRDGPEYGYRAVMIDCARHFQSVEVLRQVVDLCRLYKVRYLQLHMTDNESFTFPSEAFPDAPTRGRTYARDALVELDRYAEARGVGIVPELDVPGHSTALVRAYPKVFGLGDRGRNPSLVHIGRQAAYEGIDVLLGEVCEVFDSSPWIHVGGDESDLTGVSDDAEALAFMEQQGIDEVEDLYRHFLARVHAMVVERGRQTLMWEGFGPGGKVRVPEDATVLVWDGSYHRPDRLAEAGHDVVNATWQPLYIVGGGRRAPHAAPRMWTPEEVYAWHARRWEHFDPSSPAFGGLEIPDTATVRGGQMCVWEQREHTTVEHLRSRLPAFAERLWNPDPPGFSHFRRRWPAADSRLRALARPVTVLPRPEAGRLAHGFRQRVTVTIVSRAEGDVRYTVDGTLPTAQAKRYEGPFRVERDALVRARLFRSDGTVLGGSDWAALCAESEPVVRYALYRAPREGWSTVPDFGRLEPYAEGMRPAFRGGEQAGTLGIVQESVLRVPEAGAYRFRLESCDGPARLLLDGEVAVAHHEVGQWKGTVGTVELPSGEVDLRLEAAQGPLHTLLRLTWMPPGAEGWQRIEPRLRLPR